MPQTTPPVPVGPATQAGLAGAAAMFVGAVVAASQGLTTESVAAVVTSGLTLLTVLGGRYAQAALDIRTGARQAKPVVDAVASWELPEGIDPDPLDHAFDAGKLLEDDADELDLPPELLEPTPADQVPPDEGDYGAAGEQIPNGGGR